MIGNSLLSFLRSHPNQKERLRKALNAVGYDTSDWMRIVMYRRCFAWVRSLQPEKLGVLEISAGPQWVREFAFRQYRGTHYPEFDVCSDILEDRFDLIIADQVFEHLRWPHRAARNVYS